MKKILNIIIDEEARSLNISSELFRKITDRGSVIAFNDDLKGLISKLEKESISDEYLRYIILTCAIGGSIEHSLKFEN